MAWFKTLMVMILLVLAGIYAACYTVEQGHKALILNLGQLKKDQTTHQVSIITAGLHWRLPFFNTPVVFDTRVHMFSRLLKSVFTADKKSLWVSYYASWRIADLALYYQRNGALGQRALILLEQKINHKLRVLLGQKTLVQLTHHRLSQRILILKNQLKNEAKHLGIALIDLRIKNIDFTQNAREEALKTINQERLRLSAQYRTQAQAQIAAIQEQSQAQANEILARARLKAQAIRARGEVKAALIDANAYHQNPQFYVFYQNLLLYKKAFSHAQDAVILNSRSHFLMPLLSMHAGFKESSLQRKSQKQA